MISAAPPSVEDRTSEAMGLVFYEQYSHERAYSWLAWREGVIEPEHSLNKSPLSTIMVLDKWLSQNALHAQSREAQRWTEQLLAACAAWAWPPNSTSTELYYRMGQILATPGRLDFIGQWQPGDGRISSLLDWCLLLEDSVRPKLSASIGYQLQDNGVVLCAPQEGVLDALCSRFFNETQALSSNIDILWRSPMVLANAEHAQTLAHLSPASLPAALTRCLRSGRYFDDPADAPKIHPAVFTMDPARSDPKELLAALSGAYTMAFGATPSAHAQSLWSEASNAFPTYAGLLHTVVSMHGAEALKSTHPMQSSLVEYVKNMQQEKIPATLAVEGMFESLTGPV